MKLVVMSDPHWDWITHGVRRFEELEAAAMETVEAASREKADAWVCAGDVSDPDSGSCVFRSVELMIRLAMELHERKIPSIWVAGNHDTIEDGSRDTSLAPLRALQKQTSTYVFEHPGVVRLDESPSRTVSILALPFTSATHPYDVESTAIALLAGTKPADVAVVGHLHVPGVEPGEETKEMPRGREVWLPVDALKPRASVIINGHYHRQQKTESGVLIPGSLARLTFCEERHVPGYLVVEF